MATAIGEHHFTIYTDPKVNARLLYEISRETDNTDYINITFKPGMVNASGNTGAYIYNRAAVNIFLYYNNKWNKVVSNLTVKPAAQAYLGFNWYENTKTVRMNYPDEGDIAVYMEEADTGYSDGWNNFQWGSPVDSPHGTITAPENHSKVYDARGNKTKYVWKTTDRGVTWKKCDAYRLWNNGNSYEKIR